MLGVFQLAIPATEKLVLIAMADHAHTDGGGCYPSVETLTKKTSLSRRSIQRALRNAEKAGLLTPVSKSRGGRHVTTEYRLNWETQSKPVSKQNTSVTRFATRETASKLSRDSANGDPKTATQRREKQRHSDARIKESESKTEPIIESPAYSENCHHRHPSLNTSQADRMDENIVYRCPRWNIKENAYRRVLRFKASAFEEIKRLYGNRFDDEVIGDVLDTIESRATNPPQSVNYFLTAFSNEVPNIDFLPSIKSESLISRLRTLGVSIDLFEGYLEVRESMGFQPYPRDVDLICAELARLKSEGSSPTEVLEEAVIRWSCKLYPQ